MPKVNISHFIGIGQEQPMIKKMACPKCGSKDNLVVYPDGGFHCFTPGCGYHSNGNKENERKPMEETPRAPPKVEGEHSDIKDRGISLNTAKKYNIKVVKDTAGNIKEHWYPYYSRDNTREVTGAKCRIVEEKSFYSQGNIVTAGLFGQQLFPKGGKFITICEGELDAASAYQMLSEQYPNSPVVSIPTGAAGAMKALKHNLEYLESFENVRICFDADAAGQEAANEIAALFKPGKATIVKMGRGYKDANDYLKAGKKKEFIDSWWRAEKWTPVGIVSSANMWERLLNRKEVKSTPYPWDTLNKMTYGIRKGELVVFTADTGVGKTAILREIQYNLLQNNKDVKIGTMFLEEVPEDSTEGIMSIHANKRFNLPDTEYSIDEYQRAYKETCGQGRLFFYDHFGSNNIDEILARVRYYAKGLDCDYIIIDHLSIIVSDQSNGDERKALDEITTKLKTLTVELDIAVLAVVHTNRQGQIRGTAGIEQLANMVVHLERDRNNESELIRNTTYLTVWKNRFCGTSGPAGYLYYDGDTGRLSELPEDPRKVLGEFEKG